MVSDWSWSIVGVLVGSRGGTPNRCWVFRVSQMCIGRGLMCSSELDVI